MKLSENPVFLTRKRLVDRGGVLAAILIALLVGVSLFLGMVASLEQQFVVYKSPQATSRMLYAWIIVAQVVVLIIAGFSRISRALTEDRRAGLWDSNRLTPLRPSHLILGYWLAPALRECYMALMLAGFGLLIVLMGHQSFGLWLGTQVLIFSTALFFGLMGVVSGMTFKRSQGVLIILVFVFLFPMSFIAPSRLLSNYLLPIYGIVHLFQASMKHPAYDWMEPSQVFGLSLPAVLLSLLVQLIVGVFVWRILLRKTARPFELPLLRWEAVSLFAILIIAQHGLLWNIWRGHFPELAVGSAGYSQHDVLLPLVHGGALVVGLVLLTFASPLPEQIRLESLRLGFKNPGAIISRSSVSLALLLAAIDDAVLYLHFFNSPPGSWRIFAVAAIHFAEVLLLYALLLEFCRLRHKRRALGFVALWLFILCAIPFILAGVFDNAGFAKFSLCAPGFIALARVRDQMPTDWNLLFEIELLHLAIIIVFYFAWHREWSQLLARSKPISTKIKPVEDSA